MFNRILKLDTVLIAPLIISELDTTSKEDTGEGEEYGEGGQLEMSISTK